MNIKQTITHNLLNVPGWRTNRHIVVIESDDWGSIRMPSKEVYDKLLKEGYRASRFGAAHGRHHLPSHQFRDLLFLFNSQHLLVVCFH